MKGTPWEINGHFGNFWHNANDNEKVRILSFVSTLSGFKPISEEILDKCSELVVGGSPEIKYYALEVLSKVQNPPDNSLKLCDFISNPNEKPSYKYLAARALKGTGVKVPQEQIDRMFEALSLDNNEDEYVPKVMAELSDLGTPTRKNIIDKVREDADKQWK
jgi:hypothetical protein